MEWGFSKSQLWLEIFSKVSQQHLNHQAKSLKYLRSTNISKSSNKKLKIVNKKLEIVVTTLSHYNK